MKNENQSKTFSLLKKRLFCVFLVCLLAMTCMIAVSCKSDPKDPPGVTLEMGDYYYDAGGIEHVLTIGEDKVYTYSAAGVKSEGKYKTNGNAVTFDDTYLSAIEENGAIIMTVNGTTMRFIKKINYTVNFTGNNSSLFTQSVLNGKKVSKPEDPERNGYQFIGWYSDAQFKTPFRFDSSVVTSDLTLYARWAEGSANEYEYTIKFDLNYEGAEAISTTLQTIGGKVYDLNLPTPPVRSGYEFKGWWVSMYDDATKLSYACTEEITFKQHTTLYAAWDAVGATNKLPSPIVNIDGDTISWAGIENASKYTIKVTGPNDYLVNASETRLSYDLALDDEVAGDYVITIVAESAVSANNSEPRVIYYKNKALNQVSHFEVIGESTLKFNPIENAEKYLISIVCGDPEHNHVDIDNGASTTYDFGNCEMLTEGIVFVVKAQSAGYITSESNEYVLVRNLDAITGLTVNDNETVSWDPVQNADEYVVTIVTSEGQESFRVDTESFDLKGYDPVGMRIEVYPYAKGYNSSIAKAIKYNKVSLSSPAQLGLAGETIVWDKVSGATGYIVKIGDTTYETDENSLELVKDVHYVDGQISCDISVLAVGLTEANNSEYSDTVTLTFGTMQADGVWYENGKLAWMSVINVQKYEVQLNDNDAFDVDATANNVEIIFEKAGLNTLKIRCYDANGKACDWVTIEVMAYAISFDTAGGDRVQPQYKAAGDPIELPESYRSGYDLLGWYDAPNGSATGATKYVEGVAFKGEDTVIYACWQAKTYNIIYDYAGKEVAADTPSAGSAVYEQEYTLHVPISTEGDVVFVGWFSDTAGRGDQYTDKDGKSLNNWTLPSDAKVYAFWATVFTFTENPADGTYNVAMGPDLKNNKSITEITIPSTYKGVQVRTVSSYAFDNCRYLLRINIPDTIEVIEADTAFYRCSLLEYVDIYEVEGNTKEKLWSDSDGVLVFKDNVTGYMSLAFVPLGKGGSFVIPNTVTEVPLKVFAGSLVEEVTIPASVTVIRESAFFNCKNLTTVYFEENNSESALLVVEAKAFENCAKLESITLPAHLTDVSVSMFSGCDNLANIHMAPGSQLYTSKDGMLCEENGTKVVICPVGKSGKVRIPLGVVKIGANSFAGCNKITELEIPAVVTTIEEGAFRELSSLVSVVFKAGALAPQTIGNYAFYRCNDLAEIIFEVVDNNVPPTPNKPEDDTYTYIASIGDYAFANTDLSSLVIPGTTTTVGAYAFADCKMIRTVTFAEAIGGAKLSFGDFAFQNCTGIEQINLPASVTELALAIFDGCTNLQNVFVAENSEHFMDIDGILFNKIIEEGKDPYPTELWFYPMGRKGAYTSMPSTVQQIKQNVFKNNTNLTGITISENIIRIGANAFNGCSGLTSIEIKDAENTLTLETGAFENCISLKSIVLPKRVSEIPQRLFYGCSSLTDIEIKGNVTKFEAYSFAYTGLTSLLLPSTVTSIGNYAFSGSNIVNLKMPAGVSFGTHVFYQCKALQSVTFADDFTGKTISNYMFAESSLSSIVLPTSITSIGDYAFSKADKLTSVTFKDNKSNLGTIGTYVFQYTPIISFTLPDSVTSIGNYAFYRMTELQEFNISATSNLSTIGTYAFQYSTLPYIFIPQKVKTINNYAFDNCAKLTTVEFDQNGTTALTINRQAFANTGITGAMNFPKRLATLQVYTTGSGSNKVNDAYIYDVFKGSSKITAFNIAEGNAKYSSVNGIIYSADKTIIWKAPEGLVGDVIIPNTVTMVKSHAFYNCTKVTSVTFEELDTGATGSVVIGSYNPGTTVYDVNQGYTFAGMSQLKSVTLPQHLTYIGYRGFYQCTLLESISIPSAVVVIYNNAFYNCSSLKSVTFEKEIDGSRALTTIGNYAFNGCISLTSFVVPKQLTTLSSSLLYNCESLTDLTFEAYTAEEGSKLESIASSALGYLGTGVGNLRLPSTVTSIDKYAFSGTYFDSLTIPKDITALPELGRGAFMNYYVEEGHEHFKSVDGVLYSNDGGATYGTKLMAVPALRESFEIPEGVKEVVATAFQFTNVKTLTVAGSVVLFGEYAFSYCSLENITFKDGTEDLVMRETFRSTGLKSITVPYRTVDMGNGAFQGSADLETVIFEDTKEKPSRLKNIGAGGQDYNANNVAYNLTFFRGCTSLKTVVLPSSLETIGHAFANCTSLEEIVIPSGVIEIPASAFQGCTSLKKVTISPNLTGIGDYAFQNTALTTLAIAGEEAVEGEIHIPGSLINLGVGAFNNATAIKKIVFGEGCQITEIKDYTFAGCSALESVNLPETIESIGKHAFGFKSQTFSANGSTSSLKDVDSPVMLKSVNIPDGVKTIGEYAFYGCASLAGEKIPTSITTLGQYAFYGCASLTEITIPATLAVVSPYAFSGCSGVTTLTMYEGVTELGDYAFEFCSGITEIYIPGSIIKFGKNPFLGWSGLETAELDPTNISAIVDDGAMYNSERSRLISYMGDGSETFVIPESVREVAPGAFAGSNISSIVFHDGIEAIPERAFENCAKLETIVLPDSIRSIGASAFRGSALKSIFIGKNINELGDYAFADCLSLSDVKFSMEGLECLPLGQYLFYNCTALQTITLPRRVSSDYYLYDYNSKGYPRYAGQYAIGSYAFANCTNLKEIKFDTTGAVREGDKQFCLSIATYAFSNCTSLVSITFPEHMNHIKPETVKYSQGNKNGTAGYTKLTPYSTGSYMFQGCTSLVEVKFDGAPFDYWTSGIFKDCTSLKRFNVKEGEPDCINMESAATSAGSNTFENCASITKVILPKNITSLSSNVFTNCTKLTEIDIPAGVTSLGNSLFKNCTSLKRVGMPEKLSTINMFAFQNCSSLESIFIPDTCKQIGSMGSWMSGESYEGMVFAGCTSLKEIYLPVGISQIWGWTFQGWTANQTIYLGDTTPGQYWDKAAFDDCKATIKWGASRDDLGKNNDVR
ncbi:MAG: leucine-rich repeat protein [Clostridia bacterium]|nr:leucine-rich repeat protein [Clostridia bacterium]